ncbi:MAG: methyltransferase domain-containing protein [Nanoarchaeota archaeon]|nr:methyltransferase domain-containing protein [Nanoarchaeota archaeon]
MDLEQIAYPLTSCKTKPNKIMRERILPFLQEHDVKRVLDYGCGRYLRDSAFLAENGFTVDAVDLEEQVENIDSERVRFVKSVSSSINESNYDAALLNFVLQVLPTEEQRQKVLSKVCAVIKPDGYLVLSLRNQRDMKHCVEHQGTPYNDGFLMRRGKQYTFVRGYEREEVEAILSKMDIVEIIRTCDSFITISQKTKLYSILKGGRAIQSPMPGEYAGNSPRKIFGRLDCGTGKRLMKPENRVFFHTLEDAVTQGYRPCNNCKPINEQDFEKIRDLIPEQTLEEFYKRRTK